MAPEPEVLRVDGYPLQCARRLLTIHARKPIHPACAAAVEATARLCAALGHDIEEARPDFAGLPLSRAWRVIPAANLWLNVNARARALGREPVPGDVEPMTWAWMQEGRRFTTAEYMETVAIRHSHGCIADHLCRLWRNMPCVSGWRSPLRHRRGVLLPRSP